MFANLNAQPVIVIGANGFVGRRVVEKLGANERFRPIAASRKPPQNKAVEWRACDSTDVNSMAAALAGQAFAVNCVAGSAKTMEMTTRILCDLATKVGLNRIVHLSSMSVYGSATGLVDETRALDASASWYAKAKVESEKLVQAFTAQGGDSVTLRPGCIHGPESEQWTGLIGRLLCYHRIGDLGPAGDGICNLIFIDDVANAVIAALTRPEIKGQIYNLSDQNPGSWNRYFMNLAQAIDATPVSRISARWLKVERLSAAPLRAAAIAARMAGIKGLPIDALPRSLLPLWQQDIQLDSRKADANLQFQRTPPEVAIATAAVWFKASMVEPQIKQV